MDIQIRLATKEDAPAFHEIIAACSQQLHEQNYDHWRDYYTAEKIDTRFTKTQTYVATTKTRVNERTSDAVIACVCYDEIVAPDQFKEKYNVDFTNSGMSLAYITTLAVHPDMQGRGTGDKLMDFVESLAKQQQKTPVLTMRTELKNLVEFYARRKYTQVGLMTCDPAEHYALMIKKF